MAKKTPSNLTIKNYHGGTQLFIIDDEGNAICTHGLRNIDEAIEWADKHYPESNLDVQVVYE